MLLGKCVVGVVCCWGGVLCGWCVVESCVVVVVCCWSGVLLKWCFVLMLCCRSGGVFMGWCLIGVVVEC